jgi:hypothetical protein
MGVFLNLTSKLEVGVEESIVNALPDYNSDQSSLTFCVVCVFNMQFEKSMFLRRVAHSQSSLQRLLRRQIKKKKHLLQSILTLIFYCFYPSQRFLFIYD